MRFLYPLLSIACALMWPTLAVAQEDLNFNESIRRLIERGERSQTTRTADTVPSARPASTPVDETPRRFIEPSARVAALRMSDEAIYWSRRYVNPNPVSYYATYRDTAIINSLFMPPLFKKGHVMPIDTLSFSHPAPRSVTAFSTPQINSPRLFKPQALVLWLRDGAYRHVQYHQPRAFRHTAESLPTERTYRINHQHRKVELDVPRYEPSADDFEAPPKFIPDRLYWTSSFESSIKFSENYASGNWHKGGTETAILNIFTKNALQYNYARDRIKLENRLDLTASLYSAPKDSLHAYKVGDDLFRLYSNLGIKAFSKWFYTLNAEFKTQIFTNYRENTMRQQAALLAPYTINLGLGMEYAYKKRYKRRDRSLEFAVNLAPISYTFMHSLRDSIDLGRHGFEKDPSTGRYRTMLSKFGSTIRFDLKLKPNRNVTWTSKFYGFTSYNRTIAEFENSLDLAVSRFFSTLIYLNLRFDDGGSRTGPGGSYLQYNQLLSFGFSYKW